MKPALHAAALALSILSMLTPRPAQAAAAGPSAAGAGAVSLGDGLRREFAFEAFIHEDGSVTGHVTLRDRAGVPDQNVDGADEPGLEPLPEGLEMTVSVDSMKVQNNRAALSGAVTSTNHPRYAGLRVILAVEDNGAGPQDAASDRLTWGVYPRAAERVVTDAENPDAGMYPVREREFDSDRFPLSSYSLSAIDEGDIQVRP